MTSIADLRAKFVPEIQSSSYAVNLESSLESIDWVQKYSAAIKTMSERIRKRVASKHLYDSWIKSREDKQGTPRQRAIAWRALEILIERDLGTAQQRLVDVPVPPEELEKHDESSLLSAAEFFLARDFVLPYYFGLQRLSNLASSNIEQFLALAGELFEVVISAGRTKQPATLSPSTQEEILSRVAEQRWNEIPKQVTNGQDVRRLLECICQLAEYETDRPSAPYAPGVTGIAISSEDCNKLVRLAREEKSPRYIKLVDVLSACIFSNWLEALPDRVQGQKGQTWMVLYLNRLLCLRFRLPLQYGGWRPRKIEDLSDWIEHGFKQPRRDKV